MSMKNTKKIVSYRNDVLAVFVLIFIVVALLTVYDLWQRSKIDESAVTIDVPPVVIKPIDMKVFDRLREME